MTFKNGYRVRIRNRTPYRAVTVYCDSLRQAFNFIVGYGREGDTVTLVRTSVDVAD
jgi:hypothetical protein